MIRLILILIKPFSDSSCPVDQGTVILVEITSIRIEMFYQKEKGDHSKLLCIDLP